MTLKEIAVKQFYRKVDKTWDTIVDGILRPAYIMTLFPVMAVISIMEQAQKDARKYRSNDPRTHKRRTP